MHEFSGSSGFIKFWDGSQYILNLGLIFGLGSKCHVALEIGVGLKFFKGQNVDARI